MKKIAGILLAAGLFACATPEKAPVSAGNDNDQFFKKNALETWNRENVAGGQGTLAGQFSFNRNNAKPEYTIKEIGWMTLAPGHSIGSHKHADNEDAYIIVSGTGEFTDSEGKTYPAAEGDITIARPGQSHALKNTGTAPLYFLDIVTKTIALTPQQMAAVNDQQFFKKGSLKTWNRENVAGGQGTLAGQFSFTRNDAKLEYTIKEIGWMTLAPGHSIGLHKHNDNDDAYIIVSGTGEFTDSSGNTYPVAGGDITIARPGQSHALKNTGNVSLYFLDVVAKDAGK